MNPTAPIITDANFFKLEHHVHPPIAVSPRPFSSLSLRTSGRISFKSGDRTMIAEADCLTFIPKGCAYITEVLEEGSMDIVHFYTDERGGDFIDAPTVIRPEHPLTFRNLFDGAIRHFASEGCDLFCMMAVYELLFEAKSELSESRELPHHRMVRCKEYIDENFCSGTLRISELAKMCGVSDTYFRREFNRFYGTSPLAYIKHKRIDLSCQLLSTGLYSITEVAMRTGFDSTSYFSCEFKRTIGCTPVEYRNRVM